MSITEKVEFIQEHPLKICVGCIHRPKFFSEPPCDTCAVTIETPTNYQSSIVPKINTEAKDFLEKFASKVLGNQ